MFVFAYQIKIDGWAVLSRMSAEEVEERPCQGPSEHEGLARGSRFVGAEPHHQDHHWHVDRSSYRPNKKEKKKKQERKKIRRERQKPRRRPHTHQQKTTT